MLKVTIEVPIRRIGDLLCCAFEGGSNYWYMIEEFHKPAHDPSTWAFLLDRPEQPVGVKDFTVFKHIDYPLNAGGALIVSDAKGTDTEKRSERLDLNSIERGMAVFVKKYPKHFAAFMGEEEDACTGDVFLQCCLFGEAVYG